MISRLNDWESRLQDVISTQKGKFIWSVNDCCQFASRCAEAVTGKNYAKNFYYNSEIEAIEIIWQYGGLRPLINSILGENVSVAQLKRGDIVELNQGENEMIGVCLGKNSAFLTRRGLTQIKTLDCSVGWNL